MATTTEALLEHLTALRRSVTTAMAEANGYKEYGNMMTDAAKAAQLAEVTTVPSARQHASDCAICTAWDGSSE